MRAQLHKAEAKVQEVRSECAAAQRVVEERLQAALSQSDAALAAARAEIKEVERRAQEAQKRASVTQQAIQQGGVWANTANGHDNNMVDRRMVAKMLTTYLEGERSDEILDLMARVLHFDTEQRQRVGAGMRQRNQGGGLLSWLGVGADARIPVKEGQTFEELLIEFVSEEEQEQRDLSTAHAQPVGTTSAVSS
eukprot:g959.t1